MDSIGLGSFHLDAAELSVSIVVVAVLGGVGVRSDLQLPLHHAAHAVVLHRHPVHERAEDLILDLLDAAVGVKVLAQRHDRRGDDLIDVIVNHPKFPKVLHLPGNSQRGNTESSQKGRKAGLTNC